MCPMIFNMNVPTINMDFTLKKFMKHGWEYLRARHRTGVLRRLPRPAVPRRRARRHAPNIEAGFAPLGMVGADAGDTAKESSTLPGTHDVENMQLMGRPTLHGRSCRCSTRVREGRCAAVGESGTTRP